ncbi:MarR family winged helix-turn-helix transcriptional regulator [Umezawaea tangerina]|uniref:MarR family transcriptional regulator n=1 Tax=Umezawaea tangerina TaxID=84725 RepID=A0A2T0SQ97_9PSEU|nr:MarR family transcriptional regulator [Umezawaea tangerina]PRY35589.1 MarR family transcriptional regulator [Umezawaea tangerina]
MTDDAPPLDAEQLGAYFALMEVSSLVQHAVEQQLRASGDLSWVQFSILARLADTPGGSARMTDLADGVVYSRSGLTYQAGLLDKAGLITRRPSSDDERSTTVTITDEGRAKVAAVLPGHVDVVRQMLLDPLSRRDLNTLGAVLTRVRDHLRAAPPRSAKPRTRGGAG